MINSEIMKGCTHGSKSVSRLQDMMSGKFVTPDLKSMLLQGDIIALSWKKISTGGNQS